MFLFIDGSALVCGWVNFPILWPHTPVQTKLNCSPPGKEYKVGLIFIRNKTFLHLRMNSNRRGGLNKMGRGALVIFWVSKFDKMSLFGSLAIEVIFVGLKRILLCFFFLGGGAREN